MHDDMTVEFFVPIYIQGSWPACVSAGVLLYTKARRFGMSLSIHVVDRDLPEIDVSPTMFYSPLLVALGLPHSRYDSATVIIPGESDAPGEIQIDHQWYRIDRSGYGNRAETVALLRLLHSQEEASVPLRQSLLGLLQQLGVRPEPGLFDLFFSMPSLEEKLAILLKLGRDTSGGLSVYEVVQMMNQSNPSEEFEVWKNGAKNTVLYPVLCELEKEWNALELSNISVYASNEMMGLQRGFIEFLGATGNKKNPLRHMRDRYQFLGGKFVTAMGKGLCYRFPDSNVPAQESFWTWLQEQVQLGADAVDMIWKKYTEPDQ